MTEQELQAYIAAIRGADEAAMAAARRRQAELAKPPGSLGKLEDMAIRVAGVTGEVCPKIEKCRVAVFAADNGVVAEGVSCAPQSVTARQAVNMTRRKTGMSALAETFGDDVAVYDVGIAADVACPAVVDRTKTELPKYLNQHCCVFNYNDHYSLKAYKQKTGEKMLVGILNVLPKLKSKNTSKLKILLFKQNSASLNKLKNLYTKIPPIKFDLYAKNIVIKNGLTKFILACSPPDRQMITNRNPLAIAR